MVWLSRISLYWQSYRYWNDRELVNKGKTYLNGFSFTSIEEAEEWVAQYYSVPDKVEADAFVKTQTEVINKVFQVCEARTRVVMNDVDDPPTYVVRWIRFSIALAVIDVKFNMKLKPKFDHPFGRNMYPEVYNYFCKINNEALRGI
ncbi:MAG: hypothetical protein C9356_20355 [Oleiphilus sp.]|nr:MAG: hypothetical protein C9356_20355 [Oleiphilus sp.]